MSFPDVRIKLVMNGKTHLGYIVQCLFFIYSHMKHTDRRQNQLEKQGRQHNIMFIFFIIWL